MAHNRTFSGHDVLGGDRYLEFDAKRKEMPSFLPLDRVCTFLLTPKVDSYHPRKHPQTYGENVFFLSIGFGCKLMFDNVLCQNRLTRVSDMKRIQ